MIPQNCGIKTHILIYLFFHATIRVELRRGGLLVSKKLALYLSMLAIGFTFLFLAIFLDLPEKLKWLFLVIAIILNVTCAVAAMRIGLKEMRPNK